MTRVSENLRNTLVAALHGSLPVFMTVETTGVGNSDVISALSVRPLGGDTATMFASVPEDKKENALKFLSMSGPAYDFMPKLDCNGMRDFLQWLHSVALGASHLQPLTYNTGFQQRYVDPVSFDLPNGTPGIGPLLDLTRFAWCVRNAPAIENDLRPGSTPEEIQTCVDAYTNRVRGAGYKDVFADWNVCDRDTITPFNKPELLERLLLKLTGNATAAELLGELGALSPDNIHLAMRGAIATLSPPTRA